MTGAEDLAGRIAVVTGAGSGLGAAMARTFAEVGMAVAALDIDEDAARATATSLAEEFGVPTTAVHSDVGDVDSVAAAAKHVGEALGGCDLLYGVMTVHHGHMPEIEITGDDTARASGQCSTTWSSRRRRAETGSASRATATTSRSTSARTASGASSAWSCRACASTRWASNAADAGRHVLRLSTVTWPSNSARASAISSRCSRVHATRGAIVSSSVAPRGVRP